MLPHTMYLVFICVCLFVFVECGPSNDSYRDQYCTDPRTMRKHPAYSEWADVYSCTKHRCQPGGRSLAIYTVGCKRVEAPESAIECEEVVEDTNMQFPFCCTRLRCLVVVRGEVWTRVLGQPWETLPAAPWSHMYKMKKPPPTENEVVNRANLGPIYELAAPEPPVEKEKSQRIRVKSTEPPDEDTETPMPRAVHTPDIVIALSAGTNSDKEDNKNENKLHRKSMTKRNRQKKFFEQILTTEEPSEEKITINPSALEPGLDVVALDQPNSEEKIRPISTATMSPQHEGQNKPTEASWDQLPSWNKADPGEEVNEQKEKPHTPRLEEQEDNKATKNNLQALVDAIGTRMKDIQSVVEKMSEKVKESKEIIKGEKDGEDDVANYRRTNEVENSKPKLKLNPGGPIQNDNRAISRKMSRYLRPSGPSTEAGAVDENANGYFSDASNSVMRRNSPNVLNLVKEPALTYMAPVENHHPKPIDHSDEKHAKRRTHRTRRTKTARRHKKHHKEAERHKKNKVTSSSETDRNQVSNEDGDAVIIN